MTTIDVDGRDIELTHPDKVLFPDIGFTKADLADYYRRIAEWMLPHIEGRPLVLQRFPDGIDGPGFIQKAVPDHYPEWIERFTVARRRGGTQTHLVADEPADLVYLAQQGCTTIHAWPTRVDDLDHPDEMIADLDPSTDDLSIVPWAAKELKSLLDSIDVLSFVKLTGSRGLHVQIPLDRTADYEEVRSVAAALAEAFAARHPDRLTTAFKKEERGERLYIDVGRNGYGQHAVVPYTLRPLPNAPVAAPIGWDELSGGFDPHRFAVANIFRRLAQKADPWADYAKQRVAASALASRLKSGDLLDT